LDDVRAALENHAVEFAALQKHNVDLSTALDAAKAQISELESRNDTQRQHLDAASAKLAAFVPPSAPAVPEIPLPEVKLPGKESVKPKSGAVGKYALGFLLAAGLSFGITGCIPLQSVGDGAKEAVKAQSTNAPLPPAPAGDSDVWYKVGAALATGGLAVVGMMTHSNIVGQLAGMLAASVPATTHDNTVTKLSAPTGTAT
jgi:hypothetical protein